jgi:hypothetical protein
LVPTGRPCGFSRYFARVRSQLANYLSGGDIEVRKTSEPDHGTIEIVPAQGFGSWPKENPRSKCNDKKLPGLNLNYKSAQGYHGSDAFDILVMYPNGFAKPQQVFASGNRVTFGGRSAGRSSGRSSGGASRNQASGRSFMGYVICTGERVQVASLGPSRSHARRVGALSYPRSIRKQWWMPAG